MELGIIEQFANAIKQEPNEKKSTYSAIVSKVDEEGVIWVYVAGSDKETPTASSATEVKKGDTVTVEWRNNKLYIAGNYSSPSVGTERADVIEQTALGALNSANAASAAAASAKESAEAASGAAARAVTDAAAAASAASAASASAAAADAKATAAGNAASDAQQSADNAQTSASNASEYAARALGNLSTVQNVAETLNWITSHGTMALTTDTALDPTHVYFVQDNNGDYIVGGVKYAVVTEPDVTDIDTYYELSIDQSLNNYVATHLAVDAEGLWIIPEDNATISSSSKKVLIAVGGTGHTYEIAGTYIIEKVSGVDVVVAAFTADGAQIGQIGESFLKMDYHSLQLVDKEGNTYFFASDLRNREGSFERIDEFTGNGSATDFLPSLQPDASKEYTVTQNGNDVTSQTQLILLNSVYYLSFNTAPAEGDEIFFTYLSVGDFRAKAYTAGMRGAGNIGMLSFVEGYLSTAKGSYSHAEGRETSASGNASHSEGFYSIASGAVAHSEGNGTIASGRYSHAEGKGSKATADGILYNGGCSHAEGYQTTASGDSGSHAEGSQTIASGFASHAQNTHTVAGYSSQTAIGKYNDNKSDTALEIGNGTSDNTRSNSHEFTWDGDMRIALDTNAASGTDYEIYSALQSLGWTDCIV